MTLTKLFARSFAVLACACGGGRVAFAQPAVSYDFGDIGVPASLTSPNQPIAVQGAVWFRFRLTAPIVGDASWLDLDTSGPSLIADPALAVYDEQGNLVTFDWDSGGGTGGDAAALSFGVGSSEPLSGNDATYGGGRISDGADGHHLRAGVYYAVVFGQTGAVDPPDFNPTWLTPSNSSTQSGNVRLRVSTGSAPTARWNENRSGLDAGDVPGTARTVYGEGPLNSLLCLYAPRAKDMFRIEICDPSSFSAVARATGDIGRDDGGSYGSILFLFGLDGRAIRAVKGGADTTMFAPGGLPVGEYYFCIQQNCGGEPNSGFHSGPYDANGARIFGPAYDVGNGVFSPDGPGAANPLAFWGRQRDCNGGRWMSTRLTLTGACYVEEPSRSCPGDIDANGSVDLTDLALLLSAFGLSCP